MRNTEELRKILDAMLQMLDWQQSLVCEAITLLAERGDDPDAPAGTDGAPSSGSN
jgi:hypothetical protein